MSSRGPEWDQVLRALVYQAHDARHTDEHEATVEAIVDAWIQWPLAEALMYLDDASELLAESDESEIAWYAEALASVERPGREQVAA